MMLIVIPIALLTVSCSVVRDHPHQVAHGDTGDYEIILKLNNDEQLIHNTRNYLSGFHFFYDWFQLQENARVQLISIRYTRISPDQLNRLLMELDNFSGMRVMEIKQLTF